MDGERIAGGLRCGEVLAELSEYLDGQLNSARVRQLQEHVRGCDTCEGFGSEFSAAVHALRAGLREAELEPEAAERLRRRLEREVESLE